MRFWISREVLLRKSIRIWLNDFPNTNKKVGYLVNKIVNMDRIMLEDIFKYYITDNEKKKEFEEKYLYKR